VYRNGGDDFRPEYLQNWVSLPSLFPRCAAQMALTATADERTQGDNHPAPQARGGALFYFRLLTGPILF